MTLLFLQVMEELGLIGLRIQRMPSEPGLMFGLPSQYNYMTVGLWWKVSVDYFSQFPVVICTLWRFGTQTLPCYKNVIFLPYLVSVTWITVDVRQTPFNNEIERRDKREHRKANKEGEGKSRLQEGSKERRSKENANSKKIIAHSENDGKPFRWLGLAQQIPMNMQLEGTIT